MIKTLDEIGQEFTIERDADNWGGDKSCLNQDYLQKYDELFTPFRDTPGLLVLEVGVFQGKSIGTFARYFSDATIHGIDINLSKVKESELMRGEGNSIKLHECDSTNPAALRDLGLPKFDIILDDGDHGNNAQELTFKNLFCSHLKPGGIYVVEDIKENASHAFFKTLPDKVNGFPQKKGFKIHGHGRKEIEKIIKAHPDSFTRCIESIEFIRRRVVIRRYPW